MLMVIYFLWYLFQKLRPYKFRLSHQRWSIWGTSITVRVISLRITSSSACCVDSGRLYRNGRPIPGIQLPRFTIGTVSHFPRSVLQAEQRRKLPSWDKPVFICAVSIAKPFWDTWKYFSYSNTTNLQNQYTQSNPTISCNGWIRKSVLWWFTSRKRASKCWGNYNTRSSYHGGTIFRKYFVKWNSRGTQKENI